MNRRTHTVVTRQDLFFGHGLQFHEVRLMLKRILVSGLLSIAGFAIVGVHLRTPDPSVVAELEVRDKLDKWKCRSRILEYGIYDFELDYSTFPPYETTCSITTFEATTGSLTGIAKQPYDSASYAQMGTIAHPKNRLYYNASLSLVNVDPFTSDAQPLSYFVPPTARGSVQGWMISSVGPDGKRDINPARDYTCPFSFQDFQKIVRLTYDPTNGLVSRGDLWDSQEFRTYEYAKRRGQGFLSYLNEADGGMSEDYGPCGK